MRSTSPRSTPTRPGQAPTTADRDARIRTSLAERSGSIEDSLGETGHAPDLIDTTGIGHCRVVVPDAWTPTPRD
jgi:hypothetical protein